MERKKREKFTDEHVAKMIEMANSGIKSKDIATEFNTHPANVCQILKKNGVSRRLTTEKHAEILHMYLNGVEVPEIAKKFDVTYGAVVYIVDKYGVRKEKNAKIHENRMTIEQKNAIPIMFLKGESALTIAKKFGVTLEAITYNLRLRGVSTNFLDKPRNEYKLNHCIFDELNENSAYWIGFLMSDGSLSISKTRDKYSCYHIDLSLSSKDELQIEEFREFIGSNHKITKFKNKDKIIHMNKKETKDTYTSSLHIVSKKIFDKLAEYGVVPNKTTREKVIGLESNRDFWRGVIDGDGSVMIINGKPSISLVGSKDLLEQFNNYAKSIYPDSNSSVHKRKDGNVHMFQTSHRYAHAIIKNLYYNCKTALDRKLAKAKEALAIYEPDLIWNEQSSDSEAA